MASVVVFSSAFQIGKAYAKKFEPFNIIKLRLLLNSLYARERTYVNECLGLLYAHRLIYLTQLSGVIHKK